MFWENTARAAKSTPAKSTAGGFFNRNRKAPAQRNAAGNPSLYREGGTEPRLTDLLSDPVTHAVMRRDRVESGDLERLLERARKGLNERPAAKREQEAA